MERGGSDNGPGRMPIVLLHTQPNNRPAMRKGNHGPILTAPASSSPAPQVASHTPVEQPRNLPINDPTPSPPPAVPPPPKCLYTKKELGVLAARIEEKESIAGLMKNIRFTHNTNVEGFMGLLATGRFMAAVEKNINFRLDIDSRYATGVTYIMKESFFNKYRDYYFDDMYAKGHAFGIFESKLPKLKKEEYEIKGENTAQWERYTCLLKSQSDFRSYQVPIGGLRPTNIDPAKFTWTDPEKSILKENSKISSVNPQLRIPWQASPGKPQQVISANDIELVLISPSALDSINEMKKKDSTTLSRLFAGFTANAKSDPNKKTLGLVYDATAALKKLKQWSDVETPPRIQPVLFNPDEPERYIHKAGREDKRGFKDNNAIEQAARQGLEFHQKFHLPGAGNNSPSAYSLLTFERFQKAYFKHLIKAEVPVESHEEHQEYKDTYDAEIAKIKAEKPEKDRLKNEQIQIFELKQEQLKKEKLEKEKLKQEKIEKKKIEKENLEKERLEKEKADKEKARKEQFEKLKAREQATKNATANRALLEKERVAKENADKEIARKERLKKLATPVFKR
jgi:hypothetical protein